jgi:hypothetical protein
MRSLAPLFVVLVVLVAAGCGSSGKSAAGPPNSVIDVSRAFSDAGLAFTSEVTSNPYIANQQVYLPGKLNNTALQNHVLAFLSGSHISNHTGWVVWVFDSKASCDSALKQLALAGWGVGQTKITRATKSNVIAVGAGFGGSQKSKFDAAIAALH